MTGVDVEARRDRIITRADGELEKAKARIAATLARYATDDFERELAYPGPDPEDLAVKEEVEAHEKRLSDERWAEIVSLSKRNRGEK